MGQPTDGTISELKVLQLIAEQDRIPLQEIRKRLLNGSDGEKKGNLIGQIDDHLVQLARTEYVTRESKPDGNDEFKCEELGEAFLLRIAVCILEQDSSTLESHP